MPARAGPTTITGRVEDILKRTPEDEVGDPREFQQALDTLLRHDAPGHPVPVRRRAAQQR